MKVIFVKIAIRTIKKNYSFWKKLVIFCIFFFEYKVDIYSLVVTKFEFRKFHKLFTHDQKFGKVFICVAFCSFFLDSSFTKGPYSPSNCIVFQFPLFSLDIYCSSLCWAFLIQLILITISPWVLFYPKFCAIIIGGTKRFWIYVTKFYIYF